MNPSKRSLSRLLRGAASPLILLLLSAMSAPDSARADGHGLWQLRPGPEWIGASYGVDPSRQRLIVVGGWTPRGSNRVVWYRDLDADSGWAGAPMPVGTPRAPRNAGLVFHPGHDAAYVVGGDSATTAGEVWALDLATLSTWTPIASTGSGPGPGLTQAWLDVGLNRLVGLAANGLWVADLVFPMTWIPVAAGPRPPNHYGSAYALDPGRHRLLAHGGATADWSRLFGSMHADLWEIAITGPDTAQWRQVTASTPYARVAHAGFYDELRDRLVLHGGAAGWLLGATDTWSMDGTSPFAGHSIAVGIPTGPTVLDAPGDALRSLSNRALWSVPLSGGTWVPRDTAAYPDPAFYHAFSTYDPRRHRMVVFGGGDQYSISNDVWVLPLDSLPRWRKLEVTGPRPEARTAASVVWDELHDRLLVYAGFRDGFEYRDTWALTLSPSPAWTELSSTSPFLSRDGPAAFDAARNRMLVWAFNPGEAAALIENRFGDALGWRSVATTGTPPTSVNALGSAFDPGRERWLVFGTGELANGNWDARVRAFDLATNQWSDAGDLNPGNLWDKVNGAFDAVGDRLVVFGGRRWTSGNTWDSPTDVRVLAFGAGGGLQTLAPAGLPPAARTFPWIAWDPVRDALVVAGSAEKDVWTLGWDRRRFRLERATAETSGNRLGWSVPGFAGQGLQLWRRTPATPWSQLALVAVDGSGHTAYEDHSVAAGSAYGYRLVDPSSSGPQPLDQIWIEAIADGTGVPPTPIVSRLLVIRDNPVVSRLRFTVHLDAATRVRCDLLDLQGRERARWDLGVLPPGDHEVDGGDLADSGAGVMFLRATAGARSETRRIVSLR